MTYVGKSISIFFIFHSFLGVTKIYRVLLRYTPVRPLLTHLVRMGGRTGGSPVKKCEIVIAIIIATSYTKVIKLRVFIQDLLCLMMANGAYIHGALIEMATLLRPLVSELCIMVKLSTFKKS